MARSGTAAGSSIDLDVHHVAQVLVVDRLHHLPEHVEALFLPGDERILLAHRPQVDSFAQVVHLGEVVAPALVDYLQHDLALDLACLISPPGNCSSRARYCSRASSREALAQLHLGGRLGELLDRELGREVLGAPRCSSCSRSQSSGYSVGHVDSTSASIVCSSMLLGAARGGPLRRSPGGAARR